MSITYQIGHALYLNITNRCTNQCGFCVRFKTDFVQGYNLKLADEPAAEEIIAAVGDPSRYREIVFCGYGEPLVRLAEVLTVSRYVKEHQGRVRINTNGHGNLIQRRNIVPELAPYLAAISISLNAADEAQYNRLCRPIFGPGTYAQVKEFVRECKKHIPEVIVTAVALPGVDIKAIQKIVKNELGVRFKLRHYDDIVREEEYGRQKKN